MGSSRHRRIHPASQVTWLTRASQTIRARLAHRRPGIGRHGEQRAETQLTNSGTYGHIQGFATTGCHPLDALSRR